MQVKHWRIQRIAGLIEYDRRIGSDFEAADDQCLSGNNLIQ